MPRISPYHLTLSDAERTELEARARRYTSPYSEVVRAKIVLYAADGLGNDEIAARLDTPRQVVSKWRKRFHRARLPGLADRPRGGRPPVFPPDVVVAVKALACELPATAGARWPAGTARIWPAPPSSRASSPRSRAPPSGAGCPPTRSSPGSTGPGSFPAIPTSRARPPASSTSTHAACEDTPLRADDFVISADEKTCIQARIRNPYRRPPAPSQPMRVEYEYDRGGALAYLAAWDVHRAKLFGRCEPTTGIDPSTGWSSRS